MMIWIVSVVAHLQIRVGPQQQTARSQCHVMGVTLQDGSMPVCVMMALPDVSGRPSMPRTSQKYSSVVKLLLTRGKVKERIWNIIVGLNMMGADVQSYLPLSQAADTCRRPDNICTLSPWD
jgi:hypothetical protein